MRIKSILLILIFLLGMTSTQGAVVDSQPAVEIIPPVEIQQTSNFDFRGLAYGPFRGVGPDQQELVKLSNLREDMQIMKDMGVNHIRTYGIGLGLYQIPGIAAQYNITTATGTWIHTSNTDNFGEIDTALTYEKYSSMVIVGNEVLTGKVGFNEGELIDFVEYAKNNRENSTFPIATAEEYVHFAKTNTSTLELERTPIGEAVDTIIVHAHPVWHKIPLADAANWTMTKFLEVQELYPEKHVILGETGWPSESVPSNPEFTPENQEIFFDDLLQLLDTYDVDSYLFSAFDENWKGEVLDGEYEIGPYWGVIEEKRYGKPAAATIANYFGGTISTDPPQAINPEINSPDDKSYDVGEEAKILWAITDGDSEQGTYTIYRNNIIQGIEGLTWENGITIEWVVDTSSAGVFEYKIVFTDGSDFEGEDIVVITVGSTESGPLGDNFTFLIIGSALAMMTMRMRKHLHGRLKV